MKVKEQEMKQHLESNPVSSGKYPSEKEFKYMK